MNQRGGIYQLGHRKKNGEHGKGKSKTRGKENVDEEKIENVAFAVCFGFNSGH